MHPQHGGRFQLDLIGGPDGGEIRYRAALYTPTERFDAEVTVRLDDGEVSISPWNPAEPPAWLVASTRAFLRSEWKARRGNDAEPWPDRITRWREERAG